MLFAIYIKNPLLQCSKFTSEVFFSIHNLKLFKIINLLFVHVPSKLFGHCVLCFESCVSQICPADYSKCWEASTKKQKRLEGSRIHITSLPRTNHAMNIIMLRDTFQLQLPMMHFENATNKIETRIRLMTKYNRRRDPVTPKRLYNETLLHQNAWRSLLIYKDLQQDWSTRKHLKPHDKDQGIEEETVIKETYQDVLCLNSKTASHWF